MPGGRGDLVDISIVKAFMRKFMNGDIDYFITPFLGNAVKYFFMVAVFHRNLHQSYLFKKGAL